MKISFGHNSEPCGNFWTILRHKLPIIHPELPIATRDLNYSVQSEFLNPKFLYKNSTNSLISLYEFLFWGLLIREFPISPFGGPPGVRSAPNQESSLAISLVSSTHWFWWATSAEASSGSSGAGVKDEKRSYTPVVE